MLLNLIPAHKSKPVVPVDGVLNPLYKRTDLDKSTALIVELPEAELFSVTVPDWLLVTVPDAHSITENNILRLALAVPTLVAVTVVEFVIPSLVMVLAKLAPEFELNPPHTIIEFAVTTDEMVILDAAEVSVSNVLKC